MAAQTTAAGSTEARPNNDPVREHEFDAAIFWRWLGTHAPLVAGWFMVLVGTVLLVLGYLGVSREALVARQLPYLLSGGLGGIGLLFIGGALLGITDIRRLNRRLDHVERLATELHSILLTSVEGGAATDDTEQLSAPLTALPNGQSYHLPGCAVVSGKDAITLTSAEVAERELTPCKLCEPQAASG